MTFVYRNITFKLKKYFLSHCCIDFLLFSSRKKDLNFAYVFGTLIQEVYVFISKYFM